MPAAVIGVLALSDGGFDLPVYQQAALLVWWPLALALAFGLLPRAVPPPGWRMAAIGLIGLASLQVASVAWGPSDDASIAAASRTLGYLGVIGLAWAGLGPRSWSLAATSLFAIAAAFTAYAVLGRLAPSLAGLDAFERSLATERLLSPLGYWNGFAAWAAATLAMALAWSAGGSDKRVRALGLGLVPLCGVAIYLTYSRGGVLAAALAVALVVGLSRDRGRAALHACVGAVATAAVIVAVRSQPAIASGSGTDGAGIVALVLVAAMVSCWLFVSPPRALRPGRSGERRRRSRPVRGGRRARFAPRPGVRPLLVGGCSALVFGLVLVALIAGRDGFGKGGDSAALSSSAPGSDPAARLVTAAGNRSAYWAEALDGFLSQPLRGEGPESFRYRWARHGSAPEQVADAHSLPLGTAAELGLLGLVALGLAVGGLGAGAVRGLRAAARSGPALGLAAAAATFLASTLIDWTWELPALTYLGLASAAVLAMAGSRPLGRKARENPRGAWRWGLVGVAVVAGAMQVPGIVSTEFARSAAEQRALGSPASAIGQADHAVTAAPWSAAAYAVRSAAELDRGRVDAAERDALEAVRREPLEPLHRLLLAEVALERGRVGAALAEIRRARRLSPLAINRLGRPALELIARIERARELRNE